MATGTLNKPVVARCAADIRCYRHSVRRAAALGLIENPGRLLRRMTDQLAARESDIETAEPLTKPEPRRTDEENQLSEEELRDRNLRTSVPGKEQL